MGIYLDILSQILFVGILLAAAIQLEWVCFEKPKVILVIEFSFQKIIRVHFGSSNFVFLILCFLLFHIAFLHLRPVEIPLWHDPSLIPEP